MVVEDNSGVIVGYCVAASSYKVYTERQSKNLLCLSEKYPKVMIILKL